MANPHPSPGTRIKRGEVRNPQGARAHRPEIRALKKLTVETYRFDESADFYCADWVARESQDVDLEFRSSLLSKKDYITSTAREVARGVLEGLVELPRLRVQREPISVKGHSEETELSRVLSFLIGSQNTVYPFFARVVQVYLDRHNYGAYDTAQNRAKLRESSLST
jgi:hypothetical protein